QRPVHQRVALLDVVAGVDADRLAARHQVLALQAGRLAVLVHRLDDDGPLALLRLAELDAAGDLGHDGRVARAARLEDLGDARQTAGDVLGAADLARGVRQQRAGRHRLALADAEVGLLR